MALSKEIHLLRDRRDLIDLYRDIYLECITPSL